MILAALILQAAAPQTAVDAERAFNAAAQENGQWTAFRAFAAEDAVMFVPKPTKAQAWLKDRKDPPKSVEWWPTESYVSCDGGFAVNTGGWQLPNGTVGFFTTVWRREADGSWKWIVDGGDGLKAARERPATPKVTRATCGNAPAWERDDDFPRVTDTDASADSTLVWRWTAWPDGGHAFEARLWNGDNWVPVIQDEIAAPK